MNFQVCNVLPSSNNQEVSLENEIGESETISQVDLSVIQSEPILFILQCNTEEVISNNNISEENIGEDYINQIIISNNISNNFNKEHTTTLFVTQLCNEIGTNDEDGGAKVDEQVENAVNIQTINETLVAGNDSNHERECDGTDDSRKKRNICDICKYKTSFHRDFVRHMRKHTGEKPFVCYICDKKFTRQDKLVEHKRVHFGDKRFKCQLCDYASGDSGAIRVHQRSHSGDRPYKCQMCSYQAKSSSHLITHLRTHTGDSPYFCKVATCGVAFKTSTNLNRHMKVHKCALTSPTYSNFNDIPEKLSGKSKPKVEKLLGKPPSCYICHDYIRKGVRRKKKKKRAICARCSKEHKCPHCEAAFVRADSLRSHVRLHRIPSPPPSPEPPSTAEALPVEVSDPAYPVLLYLDTPDLLADSPPPPTPLFATDNTFL